MTDKVSWDVWLHLYCPSQSRNLRDCEWSLGEIYETNRNDIFDTLSTFKAEVILIIVLFCLLMLMISIKDTLTLNATSIDLIPVYIFCRLNNILIFWNMHHAKVLLVLRVSSIYWGFKIEPHWFNGCVYQRCLQILAVIFICGVFTAVADTENMSRFILLPSQSFVSVLNQLTHCREVPVFGIKSLDWFSLCIHIHRLIPLKYCHAKKSNSRSPKQCFEISHMKFHSHLPRNHPNISSLIEIIPSDGKWHRRVNHLWLKPAYHMCFMIISYKVATYCVTWGNIMEQTV